jgi:hypothetical protein
MEDREAWAKATEDERYMAVAADAELRRRRPDEQLEPLRSAEPEPVETDAPVLDELPEWATTLERERRDFAAKLAERQTRMVPDEDPDYEDTGRAYPTWEASERDAILQPPKPLIRPVTRVMEQVKDLEAAD